MPGTQKLWQLHCLKGGLRDLVAQREFEMSREGGRETDAWIIEQRKRWINLHPEMSDCTWEMVCEDSIRFFLLAAKGENDVDES